VVAAVLVWNFLKAERVTRMEDEARVQEVVVGESSTAGDVVTALAANSADRTRVSVELDAVVAAAAAGGFAIGHGPWTRHWHVEEALQALRD